MHIQHMAGTLFDTAGPGLLYVLGDEGLPSYQCERRPAGLVEILRYQSHATNFLERMLGFRQRLSEVLGRVGSGLEICHFRDPWSGVAILDHASRNYATVYEINGLPSIELLHAFPNLPSATLAKISAEEKRCWTAADLVVTPGRSLRENLVALGVPAEKIRVIENGADPLCVTEPRPAGLPERYIVYFGALQSWQGVDVLLRAFALLADLPNLHLVICSASREHQIREYLRLARRLGLAHGPSGPRLHVRFRLSPSELRPLVASALLSVAPLTECPRNLRQGCCPLKILESMALGVPVIASDLPVVRDIIRDGIDGRLVRPERPSELARAIRVLLEYPDQRAAMGQAARLRVAQEFTWEAARAKLRQVYQALRPLLFTSADPETFTEALSGKVMHVPNC